MKILISPACAASLLFASGASAVDVRRLSPAVEQRDTLAIPRGPYLKSFFDRHRRAWGHQAGIHAAHGAAHDVVHLTPWENRHEEDSSFDARMLRLTERAPKNGPRMENYGPYVSQWAYTLYRVIDWTHALHEGTYDILSDKGIPWHEKKAWTDRAVKLYLERQEEARSPAPLDVTMRRAGVMMRPYFGYFRNNYPKASTFFFVAHWWHPAIYEAMMLGGDGAAQGRAVQGADGLLERAFQDRPQRMLLSRELMPRYSRMSPEAANIFDNLHMLHGIAYDILTYPKWTRRQKKRELYRVIKAMAYQPGDEELARKFQTPHPDVDPSRYEDWMKGLDGDMNRIMLEMLEEMMPMMMPGLTADKKQAVIEQMRMKLAPGMQAGESEGSLHDALMKVVPEMKMNPKIMEPGESDPVMMQTMLAGWLQKHGHEPEAAPLPMAAANQEAR